MDISRLRPGQLIAAGSGAALVAVMFLDWFELGTSYIARPPLAPEVTPGGTLNAREALDAIDIALLVAAAVAVGLAAATAAARTVSLPVSSGTLTSALGVLATVLVLYRISDPVGGENGDLKFGIWLGLFAAAGIAVGGYLYMQDEGTGYREQVERLRSRYAGSRRPPPAG